MFTVIHESWVDYIVVKSQMKISTIAPSTDDVHIWIAAAAGGILGTIACHAGNLPLGLLLLSLLLVLPFRRREQIDWDAGRGTIIFRRHGLGARRLEFDPDVILDLVFVPCAGSHGGMLFLATAGGLFRIGGRAYTDQAEYLKIVLRRMGCRIPDPLTRPVLDNPSFFAVERPEILVVAERQRFDFEDSVTALPVLFTAIGAGVMVVVSSEPVPWFARGFGLLFWLSFWLSLCLFNLLFPAQRLVFSPLFRGAADIASSGFLGGRRERLKNLVYTLKDSTDSDGASFSYLEIPLGAGDLSGRGSYCLHAKCRHDLDELCRFLAVRGFSPSGPVPPAPPESVDAAAVVESPSDRIVPVPKSGSVGVRFVLIVNLALVVVLAVLVLNDADSRSAARASTPVVSPGATLRNGKIAPVVLRGPVAGEVRLPPKDVVVVHVWKQECEDCMPAFDVIAGLGRDRIGFGAPVVNIAVGSADPAWATRYGVADTLVFDSGPAVVEPLGIDVFTTLVVDRDGLVRLAISPLVANYVERVRTAVRGTQPPR